MIQAQKCYSVGKHDSLKNVAQFWFAKILEFHVIPANIREYATSNDTTTQLFQLLFSKMFFFTFIT